MRKQGTHKNMHILGVIGGSIIVFLLINLHRWWRQSQGNILVL